MHENCACSLFIVITNSHKYMQMHAIVIRQTLSGVVLLSGGQHRLSNHEIITSACCFDHFSYKRTSCPDTTFIRLQCSFLCHDVQYLIFGSCNFYASVTK